MNFYFKKIAPILAGLYIPGVFAAYILVSGYLENQIVVTVCTVATLILIPVAFLLHSKACFTRTDLVVSCLLVYLVLNLILHNHATDPFVTIKYLSLFLIYLLARLINARAGWIFSIMAVGLMQAVIAILQSLHLLSGNNQYFNITGTFGNPGQLGGFLAVSFLLSLSYLLLAFRKVIPLKRKPILILMLSGNLIITLYAVALTGSRAAWLAILAGIIVLIATSGYKPPTLMKIFFPVGIILIGVMMWFYKPDSASGRLLIWKITAERTTDKPLFGYGPGSFSKHYFTWQADYFKENPDSKFIMLAGHPSHPFNEYLLVLAELGIVGIVLVFLLLVSLFNGRNTEGSKPVKTALAGCCVFAFFSYPTMIFNLIIVFSVLSACLPSPEIYGFNLSHKKRLFTLLAAFLILLYPVKYAAAYLETNEQLKQKRLRTDIILSNYKYLRTNNEFMYACCMRYLDHFSDAEQTMILQDAGRCVPHTEILCKLGYLYQQQNRYKEAENCFRKAALAVPGRIMPNFHLFQLYLDRKDTLMARQTAREILQQPLKVENTITIKVKAAAKEFLSNN